MAKTKGAAGSAVTNRPAYSRVSFLYQAAALLAGTRPATPTTTDQGKLKSNDKADDKADAARGQTPEPPPMQGMARRLLTQMRAVSRKTNMRVRPAVKHRVCKYCDTLLVEGTTCLSVVENHSRGGRKPWADVLSVTCTTCGRARRYPVTAPRQPRRPFRDDATKDAGEENEGGRQTETNKAAKTSQQSKKQEQKTLVVSRGKGLHETKAAPAKKGQNSKQGPG